MLGLEIDIRPELMERTIEMEGGIVRKVEAFGEFVRANGRDVGFDQVVEYLVERVLSDSEAADFIAYRRWRREGRGEGSSDVETVEEAGEDMDGEETAGEESWDEETGEMTRPVEEDDEQRDETTREKRTIRRDK